MKKILLIQTGGTIAMQVKDEGAELVPEVWQEVLKREIPELYEIADIETYPLFLEDSSDLSSSHWVEMASTIENNYSDFDGFVILHGTDTMAYSASAMSFALRNLDKPVIFTGSQLPFTHIRSDARRNLVNAIELATHSIKEVGICFNDRLYRGNRTTKMSVDDFNAFGSPNCEPLAEIGINIHTRNDEAFIEGAFENTAAFEKQIFVVTVHPNLHPEFLDCLNLEQLRCIVLRAYGSGNFPVQGPFNLLPFLQKCKQAGVTVIIVSQADFDAVDLSLYPAGRAALKAGVISGGDMTLEAALTKMMYLMAHHNDKAKIESLFQKSLAGERTANAV